MGWILIVAIMLPILEGFGKGGWLWLLTPVIIVFCFVFLMGQTGDSKARRNDTSFTLFVIFATPIAVPIFSGGGWWWLYSVVMWLGLIALIPWIVKLVEEARQAEDKVARKAEEKVARKAGEIRKFNEAVYPESSKARDMPSKKLDNKDLN